MILELYGVDDDERDIRKKFNKLQAVRVIDDFIEVVHKDGTCAVVAYRYDELGCLIWRTVQRSHPKFQDFPAYSGLNIFS